MPPAESPVRIAFYGDDFTGATDTLATATRAGLRSLLFLRPPTAASLAAAGPLDCIGVAGASRSMSPADMEDELAPVAACFARIGAPVVHYKTCSTFDSAPAVGNIAVAIRVLARTLAPAFVPIVAGQPGLGRFCLFGHLFAAAETGGPVFRIDRHPTMSRHPVTPMTESDLRRHLALQGLRDVAAVPYTAYARAPEELDHLVAAAIADGGGPVLFDVAHAADLAAIGRLLWRRAVERPLLAVGPSGVTQALCAHWEATGAVTANAGVARVAKADGPVFVMAGSLSPVTRRQVAAATSFAHLAVDARRLAHRDPDDLAALVREIAALLGAGADVIASTAGPADTVAPGDVAMRAVAEGSGELVARLLAAVPVRRFGVAGGDTSSWTLRALDVQALAHAGDLAPGVALCRARASDPRLDGIEVMLKGGQMGPPDLFALLRDGTAH